MLDETFSGTCRAKLAVLSPALVASAGVTGATRLSYSRFMQLFSNMGWYDAEAL